MPDSSLVFIGLHHRMLSDAAVLILRAHHSGRTALKCGGRSVGFACYSVCEFLNKIVDLNLKVPKIA